MRLLKPLLHISITLSRDIGSTTPSEAGNLRCVSWDLNSSSSTYVVANLSSRRNNYSYGQRFLISKTQTWFEWASSYNSMNFQRRERHSIPPFTFYRIRPQHHCLNRLCQTSSPKSYGMSRWTETVTLMSMRMSTATQGRCLLHVAHICPGRLLARGWYTYS
jgi:hypothetical protein